MKRIKKPSNKLYLLTRTQQNIENLKKWIELLKSPFKNASFDPDCFKVASVLSKGTEYLLSDPEKDLAQLFFPTIVDGLFGKIDHQNQDQGCIILSINNKARISFFTEKHSVQKYSDMFSNKKNNLSGTYEQMTHFFLTYMDDLIAVPKI